VRILVVNPGSSSLKLHLLDDGRLLEQRDVDHPLGDGDDAPAREALAELGSGVDAVGQRVVHGGPSYSGPVLVDDDVVATLGGLVDLAPLHQPASLRAIRAVAAVLPGVPQVACFDTTFHTTLPAEASTFALPETWRTDWGLRRYGFHGLSHSYASRRAAELLGRPDDPALRVVTCHLGSGASLAAVLGGRSVDTTMGMTPADGLVMATRPGSVDPGLLLWVLQHGGLDAGQVSTALEQESGLFGLTGTKDMHEVVTRAGSGEPVARLALDVYLHRLAALVAAMTASLRGLDVLVFTGGVGEASDVVRAGVGERLGYLGVELDPARNADARGDADVGAGSAAVATWVLTAREDLEVVREVESVLGA
jgi:acetate kinase